jgi:hypothetical protein
VKRFDYYIIALLLIAGLFGLHTLQVRDSKMKHCGKLYEKYVHATFSDKSNIAEGQEWLFYCSEEPYVHAR